MGKVALIVPYRFVPPLNGGHKAAFGFATALSNRLSCIVLSSYANQQPDGFTLLPCFPENASKYYHPRYRKVILETLTREKVSHVLFFQHYQVAFLSNALNNLGITSAIYVQNIEYQRWRSLGKWWWPWMKFYEKRAYQAADRLFFISPEDRGIAIRQFNLAPEKCHVVDYGVTLGASPDQRLQARAEIVRRHGWGPEEKLILFFGSQDYKPNLDAVLRIWQKILPEVKKQGVLPFRILICGGGLPPKYQAVAEDPLISYLGFVPDIETYIQAADIMVNPILSGGGVKTKVLESIGLGTPVVSFATGAAGIDPGFCGDQLQIVADEDDIQFAATLLSALEKDKPPTPPAFYDRYAWGNTVQPVVDWVS